MEQCFNKHQEVAWSTREHRNDTMCPRLLFKPWKVVCLALAISVPVVMFKLLSTAKVDQSHRMKTINVGLDNFLLNNEYNRLTLSTSSHDSQQASSHDSQQASSHDSQQASSHDSQQASSHDSQQASSHDSQQASSHDSNREMHYRDMFNKTFSSQVEVGPDHVSHPAKYLIYRCDDRTLKICGGWADRIKGMISGYLIANLTGRVFKIEVLSPACDIQQVVVPNLVNWSLPVSFHKVVRESKDISIMKYLDSEDLFRSVATIDFQSLPKMKAKFVYYKCNIDFLMELKKSERYKRELSWMRDLSRDEINAAIFKRLFKLPSLIHRKLSQFFSANLNPSDKLMCAHVRTGRNPSNPHDSVIRVKEEHVSNIWSLLQKVSRGVGGHKVFLMSDSENIIADAKKQSFQDKLINTEGRIVHIEKTRGVTIEDMCTGFEKVVFEQYILMHCDVLILSKSGLSRMAAYVRGSNQGLYCIDLKDDVVPCDKGNLQELYDIHG